MNRHIQQLFIDHGDEYVDKHRDKLTSQHLKVVRAIQGCGTPANGALLFVCESCRREHVLAKSCGNRMCSTCQTAKTGEWLDRRLGEQLPTHHFMITFTVPEELRPFMVLEPKVAFDALFRAASTALRKLAANERHIGVDLPGFFGILHTWGRTMQFHPHIHFVVPGGGVDKQSGQWKNSRPDFYAPVQALSKVFRGVFRDLMISADMSRFIDPLVWRRRWNVNSQAVGTNGEGTIKYLATYVFKTAITDSRIVAVHKRRVTFSYRKSGSRRRRRTTLDVDEFIRRYLMHVLPSGFMRIRYYGFMSSGANMPHDRLVALVRLARAFEIDAPDHQPQATSRPECPLCGGRLRFERIVSASAIPVAGQVSQPRLE